MSAGTIGKYERLDVLGHGTSGVVYLAWDTLLRRQVALKEIRADGPETERLLDEARVLDRLRHPHIVRIHSVDVAPGNVILLDMELVRGRNLASALKERTGEPLPESEAARIAVSVLDALGYAHERRIIHRDVKPANILMGDDGVVKLTDFGLAEALGTGSVAGGGGTYPYMAPEDFSEDASSDRRSDLWAVGVLLFEMLTGRRPFTVQRIKDPFAWKRAVEQDEPLAPTAVNDKLSPEWDAVLARALAKNKDARFGTAREFMDDILRVVPASEDTRVWANGTSRDALPGPPIVGPPSLGGNGGQKTAQMPVFAPPIPGANSGAFVFTSTGEIVYTLDELLRVAARNWDESRRALLDGRIEGFLRGIGEVYVGDLAGDMFRRGHGGESADRLLKEFLDRAQGDEPKPRPNKQREETELGTVVAPRFFSPLPPTPRTKPEGDRGQGGDAPGTEAPHEEDHDAEGNRETKSESNIRWWYWPALALSVSPTAVAVVTVLQPDAQRVSEPMIVLLFAGASAGVLSAMLLLIAVGTRMPLLARLLPVIPVSIGGLCIGGVVRHISTNSSQVSPFEVVLLASPLAFLLLQAITARVLWRLWLAVLIAGAAFTIGAFATAVN